MALVTQFTSRARIGNAARIAADLVHVAVLDPAEAIRQTEQWRSEPHAERVRKPFAQEVDPRLPFMPHIRAHIQKVMRGDRPAQPSAEHSSKSKAHVPKRERHKTHPRLASIQVQRERHLRLQFARQNLEMQKHYARPVSDE